MLRPAFRPLIALRASLPHIPHIRYLATIPPEAAVPVVPAQPIKPQVPANAPSTEWSPEFRGYRYPSSETAWFMMRKEADAKNSKCLALVLGDKWDPKLGERRLLLSAMYRGLKSSSSAQTLARAGVRLSKYWNDVEPVTGVKKAVLGGQVGDRRAKADGGRKAKKINVTPMEVWQDGRGVETKCTGCGEMGRTYEREFAGGRWIARPHYSARCSPVNLRIPTDGSPFVSAKILWQTRERLRKRENRLSLLASQWGVHNDDTDDDHHDDHNVKA